MLKKVVGFLFFALAFLLGLVGRASAAGTYDALTSSVDVAEVSVAIVALAAILTGPQVVMWCVNKLRSMLGHK